MTDTRRDFAYARALEDFRAQHGPVTRGPCEDFEQVSALLWDWCDVCGWHAYDHPGACCGPPG